MNSLRKIELPLVVLVLVSLILSFFIKEAKNVAIALALLLFITTVVKFCMVIGQRPRP